MTPDLRGARSSASSPSPAPSHHTPRPSWSRAGVGLLAFLCVAGLVFGVLVSGSSHPLWAAACVAALSGGLAWLFVAVGDEAEL